MLKPAALFACLLLVSCAATPDRQAKNRDALPECVSHDSEIDCTWSDVPDDPSSDAAQDAP